MISGGKMQEETSLYPGSAPRTRGSPFKGRYTPLPLSRGIPPAADRGM